MNNLSANLTQIWNKSQIVGIQILLYLSKFGKTIHLPFDIELRIHRTVYVFASVMFLCFLPLGFLTSSRIVIFGYIPVMIFVLLHELGHGFMMRRLGYHWSKIDLLPIGGIAHMDSVKILKNNMHHFLIAVGGPAVTLVLWMLFFVAQQATNSDVFKVWATINFYLFAFNCLVVYPMDGGRVLNCCIRWWYESDLLKSLAISKKISLWVGLVMAGVFLAKGEPMGFLIMLLMPLAAKGEYQMVGNSIVKEDITVSHEY